MSQQNRGRPIINDNTIEINNLIVEFLAKKNYNEHISYMKVIDSDARKKLKIITILEEEGINMPYWVTHDKQEIILKCKDTFCCCLAPLETGKASCINAEFESHSNERENDEPLKEYFLNIPHIKACGFEVESE